MWRALKALAARTELHGAAFATLAAAILFAHLGETHLANFDDCYYAQKAKEMVRGGDWLTPHFAGIPRLDNAPLFLWLMALAMRVLGVTNFAAILFSAVSGVLCIVLVRRVALRLGFDAFTAWMAAFVLLTTQYFMKYARHAMFDVFLTLLFLFAVDRYLVARAGRPRQWIWVGVAAGLGVLTKSALGPFPLAVCLLHFVLTRGPSALRDPWPWAAAGACILTFLPWYVYSAIVHGERFFAEHVRWLLWERAFVLTPAKRTVAGSFDYLKGIAQTYWPWLPFALVGASRLRRDRNAGLLLALWFVIVVGTMSLANEKKLWYVMTAFPCLALLSSRAIGAWIRSAQARERTIAGGFAFLLALAAVLNLTPVASSRARRPDLQVMARVARDAVPPGEKIWNLDQDYWGTNNQFLFYSDHELSEPLGDPRLVHEKLALGGTALLTRSGYERVAAAADSSVLAVIARSGDWSLVRRAAAPTAPAAIPAELGGR
ncbi:MAG: ArnT family glycosyltransferase [Candidatus Eiseniibacteriota bacterium]